MFLLLQFSRVSVVKEEGEPLSFIKTKYTFIGNKINAWFTVIENTLSFWNTLQKLYWADVFLNNKAVYSFIEWTHVRKGNRKESHLLNSMDLVTRCVFFCNICRSHSGGPQLTEVKREESCGGPSTLPPSPHLHPWRLRRIKHEWKFYTTCTVQYKYKPLLLCMYYVRCSTVNTMSLHASIISWRTLLINRYIKIKIKTSLCDHIVNKSYCTVCMYNMLIFLWHINVASPIYFIIYSTFSNIFSLLSKGFHGSPVEFF